MTFPEPTPGAGAAIRSELGWLFFVGNATMLLRLVGPISDLVAAVRDAGLEQTVRVLQRGETVPL